MQTYPTCTQRNGFMIYESFIFAMQIPVPEIPGIYISVCYVHFGIPVKSINSKN